MDNEKFFEIVRRMREAQKDYFKTRDRRIMMRSINLESVVDSMIDEHITWLKNHPAQHDLFEE